MSENENPFETEQWIDYAQRAINELVPKVKDSALVMQLVPREPTTDWDIKFCLELGVAIMLDKPIISMVQPGTKIPGHLVRVSDKIVEIDLRGDPAASQVRLREVINELVEEFGIGKEDRS